MNDLTQEQADKLAKWRWGPGAHIGQVQSEAAARRGWAQRFRVSTGGAVSDNYYGDSWAAVLRASMQSPMTDKDAELEAKLRWGMGAYVQRPGTNGACLYLVMDGKAIRGAGNSFENAFKHADATREMYDSSPAQKPIKPDVMIVAQPDLTRDEALAQAVALWGPRAYAFEAIGKAPLAVGCAGDARGTGATFREAFEDAERRRVWLRLATAFGVVGCTIAREENKDWGRLVASEVPTWAYPAGWRNAVMAAVEWCNARPTPTRMLGGIRELVQLYHDRRLRGETVATAMRSPPHGFAKALWEGYERGRPGGGR